MASSLSSILHQPHGALRHNTYRRCCCSPLTIFHHHHNPKSSSPRSHGNPRSTSLPPPLCTDFALNLTRSFYQSNPSLPNKSEGPSLRHPVARATLTASKAQPDLVADTEVSSKGGVYHETYGCQMNVNDMEIVLSIMKNAGYRQVVSVPESAEIKFINTCAIRANAEQKVWQRLNYFWFLKRHWKSNVATGRSQSLRPPKVVVLGCMAERLKEKILDADKMVDVVCGPDAYRDLPRLLEEVDYGQKGINTLLSLEETYADINPVRIFKNSVTAFVSVMRGCNNMCSFCIVPFTRGRAITSRGIHCERGGRALERGCERSNASWPKCEQLQ